MVSYQGLDSNCRYVEMVLFKDKRFEAEGEILETENMFTENGTSPRVT